ncbi:hypothetical protein MBLNU459_g4868t1 [Dothideomycetes sp. NU459]
MPRVAAPSLWQSIIPKAFRRPDDPVSVAERQKAKANKSKDWNPATFFIVMSLLIGSNAIQKISLRNDRLAFTRRTDAKIALLRETIQRVKDGEDVDVEKILGTGDPEKEKEWEEVLPAVMREIESEDTLWQAQKRKREQKAQSRETEQKPAKTISQVPVSRIEDQTTPTTATTSQTSKAPGFY